MEAVVVEQIDDGLYRCITSQLLARFKGFNAASFV